MLSHMYRMEETLPPFSSGMENALPPLSIWELRFFYLKDFKINCVLEFVVWSGWEVGSLLFFNIRAEAISRFFISYRYDFCLVIFMIGEDGEVQKLNEQPTTESIEKMPEPEKGGGGSLGGGKKIWALAVIAVLVVAAVGSYFFLLGDDSGTEDEGDVETEAIIMNIDQWNAEYAAYLMNIEYTGSPNFPNLDVDDVVIIEGNITDIEINNLPSGNVYTYIDLDGQSTSGLNFAVGLTGYGVGDSVTITISIGVIMADGIIGETVKEMFHPPSGTIGLYETEIKKDIV